MQFVSAASATTPSSQARSVSPEHAPPPGADARCAVAPVLCYPADALPAPDLAGWRAARAGWRRIAAITVPPRAAGTFRVPAGHFFRIACPEGPQVGDLNLWSADDLSERFFSGKTRALHGTHLSPGARLWSSLPHLRPTATITEDSLDWYSADAFGGRVHDVIGTRCDPYTHRLLSGGEYHHCCHSNLTRALAAETGLSLAEAEHRCTTSSTPSFPPVSPSRKVAI